MTITKIVTIILTLLLSVPVFSQNLDDELQEMMNKMKTADGYSISCSVKSYSKKGGEMIQQIKASTIASGSSSYSVIGEIEMLQTKELSIIVDSEEKLIEIRPVPKASQGGKQKGNKTTLNFDELIKLTSESELNFKLTATSGSIKTYTASNIKSGMKSVVIKLDTSKKTLVEYAVEQVDQNGNTIQYTIVDYTDFEYSVKDQSCLSTAHFYSETNGKLKGIGKYSSYKIVKR